MSSQEQYRTYYQRYVLDRPVAELEIAYQNLLKASLTAKVNQLPREAWAELDAKAEMIKGEMIRQQGGKK